MAGVKELYCNEEEKIKELLIGKSVSKINYNHLKLSDGTVLEIVGNEGCGGCASGWYDVTELNGCENIITNVTFKCDELDNDKCSYKIFVFAKDKNIKLLQVDGDDGNGYYGSGYTIYIKKEGVLESEVESE